MIESKCVRIVEVNTVIAKNELLKNQEKKKMLLSIGRDC